MPFLSLTFTVLSLAGPWHGQEPIDFEKQVLPIFKQRCFTCHAGPEASGKSRPKAGLRLDGMHWIVRGGASGAAIKPGKPEESLLYELVALPPEDLDIMPPRGDALSEQEVEWIRDWIAEGAKFGTWRGAEPGANSKEDSKSVAPAKVPSLHLLWQELNKDLQPASPATIQKLRQSGAFVEPMAPQYSLLRVNYVSKESRTTDDAVKNLQSLRSHITHLNLAKTRIQDPALKIVARMPRLTHLDLRRTAISNKGVGFLVELQHLRYLNLYGTQVSDKAIPTLAKLQHLEALYVWQTNITAAGISRLRQMLPKTKIVAELQLPPPPRPDVDENR